MTEVSSATPFEDAAAKIQQFVDSKAPVPARIAQAALGILKERGVTATPCTLRELADAAGLQHSHAGKGVHLAMKEGLIKWIPARGNHVDSWIALPGATGEVK